MRGVSLAGIARMQLRCAWGRGAGAGAHGLMHRVLVSEQREAHRDARLLKRLDEVAGEPLFDLLLALRRVLR